MELLLGAANKSELNRIDKYTQRFGLLLINDDVTKKAIELLKTYHLSHKLAIPDGIIAATALVADFELFTYNTKDFRFIKEIRLFEFK
jgi:predicted nucleic acid-binding protein